ncbi:calcium-binding protein [Falsiroseomonas oryzae]|uniref:calcium-binding protein n=1 Tax=Falsiroseomonas oryzae TaxID=2766473 RepID=UPI0022EA53DE|nr:calcium-binding protein [Roseomonas sp. MO-31]
MRGAGFQDFHRSFQDDGVVLQDFHFQASTALPAVQVAPRLLLGDGPVVLNPVPVELPDFSGTAGNDSWTGGTADDWANGGGGNDLLSGAAGNDTLNGEAGNDNLGGGDGNDLLRGGDGNDWLYGGNGEDALHGGNGADSMGGGAGNDVMDGGAGNDTARGGAGLDTVAGGAGNDWIGGEDGADQLWGGDGHDTIEGGQGDDLIIGGMGADLLAGGGGADRFWFGSLAESSGTAFGTNDAIIDFQPMIDRIDLSALDANAVASGNQAFTFVGENFLGNGPIGQLRAYQAAGMTFVEADVDGDRQYDFSLLLSNAPHVTAADFIL